MKFKITGLWAVFSKTRLSCVAFIDGNFPVKMIFRIKMITQPEVQTKKPRILGLDFLLGCQ